jgi:hypothetical protein
VLPLVLEHKRGHGALYDAVNQGRTGIKGCAGCWLGCHYRGPRMGA